MQVHFPRANSGQQGQSLVEMAAGLIVVIPVLLVCVDLATLYMGVNLNDTVCRDAARAASVGPPDAITKGEPLRRAQGVVARANSTGGAIRLDTKDVKVTENCTDLPSAPYGGPVKGEVTVTTSVQVFPPFLLSLMSQGQGQTFTTNKTFAYTWQMQNTTNVAAPSAGAQSQTF